MSWPLSQDYNEVIQDPRNSFGDAELKTGEAVTNALGIPLPRSGNFADVYEVRCPSGSRWAVKCFTREVAGLRERYNEISKYLHQTNLPFMVDFQYQEQGIRVRGQWYPILKMQWVEGFVLNEFVRDNLDKKPILQAMGQIWLRMARRLREANLAHCDLQHGNVLLVPGSTANSLAVKLIDYDGMCVPALAGTKSGEVGHPAFQHPERLKTGAYNQEVDRFSLLSIATSLRCLTVGGRALWERYDNGDNLLFRQADLQAPTESPVFKELLTIGDPQAQTLVKELYRACQGPLKKVPLLTDLMPEEKPASKVTTAPTASSSALAKQPAAARGPDWDFNEEEAGNSVVKKRRAKSGMPGWVWGAVAGAAALLLLGVGVGFGLVMRKGQDEKEGTPIAQHKPDVKPTVPKPPKPDDPHPKPDNNVNPPPNINPMPVVVNPSAKGPLAWDKPIDPSGDCKFQEVAGKLTIGIPNGVHNLAIEQGPMNAPRLLADVEGDFTVQVRVSDELGKGSQNNGLFWMGAGLVLWNDEKNYLLVQRALGTGADLFLNWESRKDGRKDQQPDGHPPLTGMDTFLRLERRGNKFIASHSKDGKRWTEQTPIEKTLPDKVKIGVTAIAMYRPLTASFDQLQLKQGQGEMVRIDKWLAPGDAVVANPSEKGPLAWDKPMDPKRKCTFQEAAGKLTVTIPHGNYNLWLTGEMAAPRLMGNVAGDFTAQVRVGGVFRDDAKGEPFFSLAAGLILWIDDNNFLELERNLSAREKLRILWSSRKDGRHHQHPRGDVFVTEMYTHLRLERRGNKLLASYSEDGKKWIELNPIEMPLPNKVKIGVIAATVQNSFTATFDQFQFKQGQGEMVRIDKWLAPGETVVVKPPQRRPRPAPSSNKWDVPDEQTLADKRKLLQVMYADDYNKGMPKKSLPAKLYDDSRQQGDLALRYAMLTDARDLAAKAGDVENALRAASELGHRFAVNLLESKCLAVEQTLSSLPASAKSKYRLLAQKSLLFLDRATIDEDFDVGARFLKVARAAALKADMTTILNKMVEREASQFDALRKEYDKVKPAVEKLQTEPDDADANLALGRFRCFIRDAWDAGLPQLVKGPDQALSEVAQKDALDPANATEQESLGDAWWNYAEKAEGKDKAACQRRAYFWYQECLADLEKKKQPRVKERLRKLVAQLPELGRPFHDLDIGPTVKRKAGMLYLPPQHMVATRQLYRGPIDIRLTVLMPKNYLRVTFLNGGEMVLSPKDRTTDVKFYTPYATDPDGQGWGPNRAFAPLIPNSLQQIRILVTQQNWTLWINDKQVLTQKSFARFPFASSPVRVWSDDGEIYVKSLEVKRIR